MQSWMNRSLVAAKAFAVCALTASLSVAAICSEATRGPQTSPRSASAALHLTVFVVPVLQADRPTAPKPQENSITFTFGSPPLSETYDLRALPDPGHDERKQGRAILRTLTVVPK
jgi:hypothetical protein